MLDCEILLLFLENYFKLKFLKWVTNAVSNKKLGFIKLT